MNRSWLLTAASVLALCAGGALAAGSPGKINSFKLAKAAQVLWDQNSNSAREGWSSMNFTSTASSSDNDQAADDFVVPKGKVWKITEVDV